MLDLNKKIQKMKWTDVSLIKLDVFFFTLFLVYFIPKLTEVDWRIYGVLWIVIWAYLMWKIWIKK